MSKTKIQTDEPEWTKANLQKLLAALKSNIPENDKRSVYTKGLKAVEWDKVAFPPFSPEACRQKWTEILQKMRKIRTLTELIDEADDAISNPLTNKRRIKIHPDLPKRPCPPNAIFYLEKYAKYHEKHPTMNSRKMLRVLNKKYQKLPDGEKALYVEKYQLESEEYQRKMQEFRKKNHLRPIPVKSPKPKRKRVTEGVQDGEEHCQDEDGLPPKPPLNGYNLFCKEQLASMPSDTRKNFVSMCAQRWRDLTEKQREAYSSRCRELKMEYSVKLDNYLETLDVEKRERILNKHGIRRPKGGETERKRCKSFPGEPKMPSKSGNVIFFQDQMELLKGGSLSSRERFIKANQMWRALSKNEKERYKEKVNEKHKKYSKELKKWFEKLTPAVQKDYLKRKPTKKLYIEAEKLEVSVRENQSYRPSDSEDESTENSSSDEEEKPSKLTEYEEYEGDGGDDIMFKMF